eukprot:TRINITY_DN34527_c0_g1_i1.p1 TRINITY_DN34527_c0_g1~~TRINITY_DN34527_c0_g1_i1.p1  ORF type:complete len:291 (+),score=84.13 TRINITY_DN34527_c0_g1_i1:68-874(+)
MASGEGAEASASRGGVDKGDYRERIARLTDKLNVVHETSGTHATTENTKVSKLDFLHDKVKKLDERVATSQDLAQKKFSALKEQLGKFQKDLEVERDTRDRLAKTKTDEIVCIDRALQQNLEAEQQALRETETRILQLFESKTHSLKEEMTSSGRLRMENEANLRRYLDQDIPKLYEALKEEVSNREAMEQRMLRKAMEEVAQLQTAISEERKAREDTEEAMLRMMEDVVTKMQGEIASERRERERTEEMLLTLLNETCSKMQVASVQ